MNAILRKTLKAAIVAASLGAMVAATSTPASAWGRHRGGGFGWGPGIAAGVLGSLAVGAIVAGSRAPAYAEPYYAPPAAYEPEGYAPACHKEWRPMYRADGLYLRDRLVRVCD